MPAYSPILLTTNDVLQNDVTAIRNTLSTSPRQGGVIQVPDTAGSNTPCALSGILDLSHVGVSDPPWQATHNYSANDIVRPTTRNGLRYQVLTDLGSSGSMQPDWPTSVGGTVTDGGLLWICRSALPLLVEVHGVNMSINSPSLRFGSHIVIGADQYIRVVGSVVRFRGITFESAGEDVKAAVVICREQRADAPGINYCGFENCNFLGEWDVAPVVAYGAELIQFRNCLFENKRMDLATAALSLDEADLHEFNDGAPDPQALSGAFNGHSSSGNHILNCLLINNGDSDERTGLRLGDAVSHMYIKGTWIAVAQGDSNIEFNGYGEEYNRYRYPRQITMDSATTFTDGQPPPTVPFRFTGTAVGTELVLGAAPF